MGTLHRYWSTEPLWLWRTVVVLWWLVVAGAVISLLSAVGSLVGAR